MDLNKLKPTNADKGATLEVVHPVTGDVIEGMTVTVRGMDSKSFHDVKLRKAQEALNEKSSSRAKKLNAVDITEAGLRDLAELTVGWTGFEFGKDEYKFSVDNAFKLYRDPAYKWLVDQIDAFVSDRANFFAG